MSVINSKHEVVVMQAVGVSELLLPVSKGAEVRAAIVEAMPLWEQRKRSFDESTVAVNAAETKLVEARRMVRMAVSWGLKGGVFFDLPALKSYQRLEGVPDLASLEYLETTYARLGGEYASIAARMNTYGQALRHAEARASAARTKVTEAEMDYNRTYFEMTAHIAEAIGVLKLAGIEYTKPKRRSPTKKKVDIAPAVAPAPPMATGAAANTTTATPFREVISA